MGQIFPFPRNSGNDIESFYWSKSMQKIIIQYIIDDSYSMIYKITDCKVLEWYIYLLNINDNDELLNNGIKCTCYLGHLQGYILLRNIINEKRSDCKFDYPLAFQFACTGGYTKLIKYMQKDLQLNKNNFPSYKVNFEIAQWQNNISMMMCLIKCFRITDENIIDYNIASLSASLICEVIIDQQK